MKLGILGSGMIAQEVLKILPLLRLEKVTLYGRESSREKLESLCRQHHLDGYFTSYQALLEGEVDTVYVALPNDLHYPFAKQALEMGKNVILEKPATSNLRELEELDALARKNGRMLFEAVSLRYLPAFESLKEALGGLGQVRLVDLNHSQYSSRYDAFRRGEVLPALDCHRSGGALMDINLYNVNAVVGLFGPPRKVTYTANLSRGIDTSGVLVLEYDQMVAVCVGAKDSFSGFTFSFQGEEGTLEVRDLPLGLLNKYRVRKRGGNWQTVQPEQKMPTLYYEFAAFQEMVGKQDFPRQQAMMDWSKEVMRVLDQARNSAGIVFDADQKTQP